MENAEEKLSCPRLFCQPIRASAALATRKRRIRLIVISDNSRKRSSLCSESNSVLVTGEKYVFAIPLRGIKTTYVGIITDRCRSNPRLIVIREEIIEFCYYVGAPYLRRGMHCIFLDDLIRHKEICCVLTFQFHFSKYLYTFCIKVLVTAIYDKVLQVAIFHYLFVTSISFLNSAQKTFRQVFLTQKIRLS